MGRDREKLKFASFILVWRVFYCLHLMRVCVCCFQKGKRNNDPSEALFHAAFRCFIKVFMKRLLHWISLLHINTLASLVYYELLLRTFFNWGSRKVLCLLLDGLKRMGRKSFHYGSRVGHSDPPSCPHCPPPPLGTVLVKRQKIEDFPSKICFVHLDNCQKCVNNWLLPFRLLMR